MEFFSDPDYNSIYVRALFNPPFRQRTYSYHLFPIFDILFRTQTLSYASLTLNTNLKTVSFVSENYYNRHLQNYLNAFSTTRDLMPYHVIPFENELPLPGTLMKEHS